MFSTQNLNLLAIIHSHRHTKQLFLLVQNIFLIAKLQTHVRVVNPRKFKQLAKSPQSSNFIRQKNPDTIAVYPVRGSFRPLDDVNIELTYSSNPSKNNQVHLV